VSADDDRFNDEVNDLLRKAAEERERQVRALADADAAQARHAFEAVVDLVKARRRAVPPAS